MAEPKEGNIIVKIIKLLLGIVVSFVCLISIFLVFYIINSQIHANDENYKPGVSIYTIVSPSMHPVIKVYDVVVNTKVQNPTDIEIGDIITYKSKAPTSEGMTITHRVIAIDQLPDGSYEFMTQGDSNKEPDSLFVAFDQIIGKEVLIVPQLGRVQFLIANQRGWLFLLLIPVSIYLLKELFKLLDLFGLRKKVDKVVSGNVVKEPTNKVYENEIRKEHIREELKSKEAKKDSREKSSKEPNSFLEPYSETQVIVLNNRYENKKAKKEIKTEIAEDTKVISPTKVDTINITELPKQEPKEIVLPKKKEVVKEYEILDTSDIENKIEEYDTTINKLNKMVKDIDNIVPEKKQKKFVEKDDFLVGNRIKVTSITPTKNQKKQVTKRKTTKTNNTQINLIPNQEILVDLAPIVLPENDRLKVSRPKSVDINVQRTIDLNIEQPKKETPKKQEENKKRKLNLNPKEVKKVNRKPKYSAPQPKPTMKPVVEPKKSTITITQPQKKKRTSNKLELNSKNIPKIQRNKKPIPPIQQPTKRVVQVAKKQRRKREPLIIIEKIK